MDFELAEVSCQKFAENGKSHLVSIHKESESQNIADLIRKNSKFSSFWIGLREAEGGKGYGWTDGNYFSKKPQKGLFSKKP